MKNKKVIDIAIVGCGTIFTYVYEAIRKNPNYKLTALCDKDPNRLQKFGDRYQVYTSYIKMAENLSSKTLIVILVPHTIRKNVLNYFLKEKFKVICEKPLFWNNNQCIKEEWPHVIYHRAFNNIVPLISDFINTQKSHIKSINLIYYEDISKQTSGSKYLYTTDIDGGGCINDNLPNCISVLDKIFDSPIVLRNTTKTIRHGITTKADITLIIDKVNCNIKLSWISPVDEKSVIIETNRGSYLFDLQNGYVCGKDSLYQEYENYFSQFSVLNNESHKTSYRILKILDIINSIK